MAAPAQVAGGSASAEYQRRRTRREERVRAKHPHIGGLLLILSDERASTTSWEKGANGERRVGAVLDAMADVIALHDRARMGKHGRPSRANIDHIAVTPSGVWVIDAKAHKGKAEVRSSIWNSCGPQLFVDSRNQTKQATGVLDQVAEVEEFLDAAGLDIPVYGVLCFVGTDIGWRKSIFDVPLINLRSLKRLVGQPGPLNPAERQIAAGRLQAHFVPALR